MASGRPGGRLSRPIQLGGGRTHPGADAGWPACHRRQLVPEGSARAAAADMSDPPALSQSRYNSEWGGGSAVDQDPGQGPDPPRPRCGLSGKRALRPEPHEPEWTTRRLCDLTRSPSIKVCSCRDCGMAGLSVRLRRGTKSQAEIRVSPARLASAPRRRCSATAASSSPAAPSLVVRVSVAGCAAPLPGRQLVRAQDSSIWKNDTLGKSG